MAYGTRILDYMAMENSTAILKKLTEAKPSSWLTDAKKNAIKTEAAIKSIQLAIHIANSIEAQGISQKSLAEKLGVSPQYISRLLKGKQNLSLETITSLEFALGITLISIPPVEQFELPKESDLSIASEEEVNYTAEAQKE